MKVYSEHIVLRTLLKTLKHNTNMQMQLQYYKLQCLIGVNLKSMTFVSI